MTEVRRTRRWRGVLGVALFSVAVGLLFKRPAVLLTAVVGVAYAAYPHLSTAPSVDLEITRRLTDENPDEGDVVVVSVSVENTTDRTIPDLRIIDGVPPMLAVVDGSPRHAAALRPGDRTRFSYTVRAEQGSHPFDPATVVARDVAGAFEVETTIDTETTIECVEGVESVPLQRQTTSRVGRIITDRGGSGIEFHRTREYRRGDPMSRIDWRRFARTGRLTTVEFRQELAATVVLCLDVRGPAFRAREPETPHAVAYCQSAALQLVDALTDAPDFVGVTALGREDCWLEPGTGTDHDDRAREFLAHHPAFSAYPPDDDQSTDRASRQLNDLRQRLDGSAQVVLLSPLTDTFPTEAAYELITDGHEVSIVSPDVTMTDTPGGKLVAVERRNQIRSLREAGVTVFDWTPPERLGTVLSVAEGRP